MFDWLRAGARSPTFETRLHAACRANGWTPFRPTAAGAELVFHDDGREFRVLVVSDGPQVVVGGYSRGEFPVGRFPPVLRAVLDRRDRELRHLSWRVIDGPKCSHAAVLVWLPVNELTGARLKRTVLDMRAEVELLDAGLRRSGLI